MIPCLEGKGHCLQRFGLNIATVQISLLEKNLARSGEQKVVIKKQLLPISFQIICQLKINNDSILPFGERV